MFRKLNDLSLKRIRHKTNHRWSILMAGAPIIKGIDNILEVEYINDGHHWHRLDIHRPEVLDKALPAIIYFHGGGWATVDKKFFHSYCQSLASYGYVVFNVDYRLAPEYRYPAQIEDGLAAVQWVQENGAKYGADVDTLILAGDSAGAHLASTLACIYTNSHYAKHVACCDYYGMADIAATVLLCGAFDMSTAVKVRTPSMGSYVKGLLNISRLQTMIDDGCWIEMSPLFHVTADFPPSFITDAYDDGLFEQSDAMRKKLYEEGVPQTTVYYGKKDGAFFHDFQIVWFMPPYQKCLDEIDLFLEKTL